MTFIRKIKKKSGVYLAEVETYREDGKVKQRVIKYIGKEEHYDMQGNLKAKQGINIRSVRKHGDYKVLHQICEKLGIMDFFKSEGLKPILVLIYTQMLDRQALYKVSKQIELTTMGELLELDSISTTKLNEAIDSLEKIDFQKIEDTIVSKYKTLFPKIEFNKGLVLDVTDTYFKGKNATWKKRRGKDGKIEKLVQIALAVSQEGGFPMRHKAYEGNISNVKIFEDLIFELKAMECETVILDRGMNSTHTLNRMKSISQQLITGLKKTKTLEKYLDKVNKEDIFQPKNMVKLGKVSVFFQAFDYKEGKLLVIYNPEKETTMKLKAMQDVEAYDEQTVKYVGFSILYHTTEIESQTVIKTYFNKDVVEKAFRNIKSFLDLNPLRKHKIDRVNAHIKICYMAYAIFTYMEQKLKVLEISAVEALDTLQSLFLVELHDQNTNTSWSDTVTLKNKQIQILKALECSV